MKSCISFLFQNLIMFQELAVLQLCILLLLALVCNKIKKRRFSTFLKYQVILGTIGVVDHDSVDLSNLHRQVAHSEAAVGTSKAISACNSIRRLNHNVRCLPHNCLITSVNAREIVAAYDIVCMYLSLCFSLLLSTFTQPALPTQSSAHAHARAPLLPTSLILSNTLFIRNKTPLYMGTAALALFVSFS